MDPRPTDEWAGGPNDKERRRNKLDNLLHIADWALGETSPDRLKSELKDVDDAARMRKSVARSKKYEYADVKSDAEAFALPRWAPLLGRLRSLGLPVQRVRSLVRGEYEGITYESFIVCDADEDGNVIPYEIRVMENRERMPDLVCDHRATRGEVPDRVAWCATPSAFAKASAVKENRPVIKESRFTKNLIGRAVADKVNGFLDTTRWVTVYAKDLRTAQAVADKAIEDNNKRRTVWMTRGPQFIYGVPLQGAQILGVRELVELQREYAELDHA